MGSADPLILSLQHFCIHDGPGIRSLVFFKGCPLHCAWCQNVESWKAEAEIGYKSALCIGCGACAAACPERAVARAGSRDPSLCRRCFSCVEACPSGATVRFGTAMTPCGIVEALRPEFPLYLSSGGGVTLSGGEPALHPGFASLLAGLLREEGVSVAMETCGMFHLDHAAPLLRELDLVLFDVKIFDPVELHRLCGGDARLIRENLEALAGAWRRREGPCVWPRLPVVPGMTAGEDNIRAWAGFLRGLGIESLTVVPYHPMGAVKRAWLGIPDGPGLRVPGEEELEAISRLLSEHGIRACRPGDEDFPAGLAGSREEQP
jgi:glycyl-radical enzyme activating protein